MDYQIAMLWMRGNLSFLEQLCVQSFLDAGHHVVLYSYEPIGDVPNGVECRDASDIIPGETIIVHERTGSPAPHADLFRYKLLEQSDRTIWADTDAYCAKPFQPLDGYFYGWESEHHVNIGVLGLPNDSQTLAALIEFTNDEFAIPPWESEKRQEKLRVDREQGLSVHVGAGTWGVWGPQAFTHFLQATGEISRALPQEVLYPYSFAKRRKMLVPNQDHSSVITDKTQSIHLYGRRLRKRMAEVDHGLPHPDSLVGSLLLKHKIDPCDAPLRDWPNPDRDTAFARTYRENVTGRRYSAATPIRPLESVVAVTTMKNEGPFILDWVAYHLSIGITHFLVYTNDCSDSTCEILDGLQARGLVTRVDNPVAAGERPQRVALELAGTHPKVTEADAYVVMDVDEYINIHVGDGTLQDLFRAAGDPDLLSMTWRFFGCNGVVGYEDRPVAEQFTRAAPLFTRKPHQNWGFKTIVRREAPYKKLGVHRPLETDTDEIPKWSNGSGKQMPSSYLHDGWRSNKRSWGYDLVTLNHYALRSLESFLVKRDRGRTNHINRDQGISYWNLYNRNEERDDSILLKSSRSRPIRQILARDPVLGAAHSRAVTWHQERIRTLMRTAEFADLYQSLAFAPLSRDHIDPVAQSSEVSTVRKQANTAADNADPESTGRVTQAGDPVLIGVAADRAYQSLQGRAQRHAFLDGTRNAPSRDRICVITSMRNEGPFILEWIAYHQSIGVTDFLVFTNDCDDPTDAILDRLAEIGALTRLDNPYDATKGERPQWVALNEANSHPLVLNADWRIVIDCDEFINVHVGDGTIPRMLAEMQEPNVVSMTWKFFGNAGLQRYEDEFVIEQFTQSAPRFIPKPRLGWGFKSMFHRDAPFGKLGVHRPQELDLSRIAEVRWVNGSGRRMPDALVQGAGWRSTKRTVGYDMVTLNHYVLRSAESYLVKRARGRINHVDQDQGLEYWARRNYCTEKDDSILRHLPRMRAAYDALLSDKEIFALHQKAVGWHKHKIAELKRTDDFAELYQAISRADQEDAIFHNAVPLSETTAFKAAE